MGLFSRPGPQAAGGAEDGSEESVHQFAAIALVDALAEHDSAGLARLTPAERAHQLRIRQDLHAYFDQLWDQPKTEGSHPADLPEYDSVAGIRDLTANLVAHVEMAQVAAGDPDVA